APPIARCSHRAKRRNIRRDSNRYWVKLQGQVRISDRPQAQVDGPKQVSSRRDPSAEMVILETDQDVEW
ncbi:hypothetical protein ABIA85_009612, partial [Bradyrhizobium sp. LA6.10]|uniref:hypothetical protein n=1 Tax=Bradyrhizobium sp. LA6.10 TaxID=3156318 RepID=UPI0033978209